MLIDRRVVKETALAVVCASIEKRQGYRSGKCISNGNGTQGRGRPAKRWNDVVGNKVRVMGLEKGVAINRETWRRRIHGPAKPCSRGKYPGQGKNVCVFCVLRD